MIKNIFTFTACIFTLLASSQKISEQELQGNWKLTALNTAGITLDVASGKIFSSKENDVTIPPDALAIIKDNIKQYGESLKNSYITITGSDIKQTMDDKTKFGSFTIKDYKKIQLISTTYNDGTTSEVPVKIVNGKLCITNHKSKNELIYSKE
ncbi:hypothetical protein [Flavobacterium cerinum]|uniref:Lipocalin-like domain-containing protein n=1 Tax=Flavobacterium cerinum TaxID=2502784 RepID=A0A444HG30_9FLAO|nr:hypothetical protein [Flavobacterium cerinum]RWX03823.1 hypothetical protein EPI11_02510 [Flavobacterium cerinum]